MISVRSITIVDWSRTKIAIRTEAGWIDPYGGVFSADDQRALTDIASQCDGMTHTIRGIAIERPRVYVTF